MGMGRLPRMHFPGVLFHVMSRGNGGQPIFLDPADWPRFLDIMGDVRSVRPFKLRAYCLMQNHFHLLVELDRFPLSKIMQLILCRYASYLNQRHDRNGHLFQSRYKALLCEKDSYLLELVRYLHLNPVRAKLTGTAGAWPWSSHHAYLGNDAAELVDTDLVLSMFASEPGKSRALYLKFLGDNCSGITEISANGEEPRQLVGFEKRSEDPPKTSLPDTVAGLSLETLCEETAAKTCVTADALRSGNRARSVANARADFIIRAFEAGHCAAAIAAFVGLSQSAVCRQVRKVQ